MSKLGRCTNCDTVLIKSTAQTPEGKPLEVYLCPTCTAKDSKGDTVSKAVDKWGMEVLKK